MAKKKTRQQDPAESTDSGGEERDSPSVSKCCPHISKAVDLNSVKKKLKGGTLSAVCSSCSKGTGAKEPAPGEENDGTLSDTTIRLYMCLKCGHVGCGREQLQHALNHFLAPRSEVHALVVEIDSWTVWCYECELAMAMKSTKKLQECVEYIRRHLQSGASTVSSTSKSECASSTGVEVSTCPVAAAEVATAAGVNVVRAVVSNYQNNKGKVHKIRGLMNLGNTCFFNSVLQCLSVTPFLVPVLQGLSKPGEKFTLHGDPDTPDVDIPSVEGELGETSPLTSALLSLLLDMQSTTLAASSLRPQKLLSQVQARFSQFQGNDQHDAHELLRHLLEGVRADDLKRHQRVVLIKNGLQKVPLNDVDGKDRKKMKLYGQQLQELTLGPESIFKGQLVSMLECQVCLHLSTRTENFLDLSLPVAEDKPLPPNRKKEHVDNTYGDEAPSKYQLKKQKKEAKRSRKGAKSRRGDPTGAGTSTPTIIEENGNVVNGVESEQSDADVEDNIEQESSSTLDRKEVEESGYSSERHHTGESDRTSPRPPALRQDSPECTWADFYTPVNGRGGAGNCNSDYHYNNGDDNNHYNNNNNSGNCASKDDLEENSSALSPMSPIEELNISIPSTENDLELIRLNTSPVNDLLNSTVRSTTCQYSIHSSPSLDLNVSHTSPQSVVDDRPVSRLEFSPSKMDALCGSPCRDGSQDADHSIHGPDLEQRLLSLCLSPEKKNEKEQMVSSNVKECIESGTDSHPFVHEKPVCNSSNHTIKSDPSSWCQTLAPRYHQSEEGECSVISCLNQFTSLELMTGNNKAGCDACTQRQNKGKEGKTVYTNSTKQFLISSPPAVLILHLKRFMMENFRLKKLQRYVSFPVELDMAPFCSNRCKDRSTVGQDQTEVRYVLYGIVEHSGTLNCGHYVAYIKVRPSLGDSDPRWSFLSQNRSFLCPSKPAPSTIPADIASSTCPTSDSATGEKWYVISDSRVTEISEAKVLKTQAYLLFYERVV